MTAFDPLMEFFKIPWYNYLKVVKEFFLVFFIVQSPLYIQGLF